ncbi:hypothetical protein K493DRAFT_296978 [Basidiobolus meristosporus CBS 931.73]|uniref:Extracellular membrane protein CFEM domain-containing protein n=1 Tax=Basidiobolus meristosporus CBS 931.73 TaxID=1314790 RepID=A0A1Y1Z290_9FUNG|nr:hypothetical protein K493DRAFT_296978 [Basidiobolus meristosporus CBS 931.73]|eukprot:ORY04408.1 hypothetical protein K493DRAFT_296978 [Basidiobolus meristosporus CBS 931.73]
MFHTARHLSASFLVVLLSSGLANSANLSRDCEDCMIGHLLRIPGCSQSKLALPFLPSNPDFDQQCHCNLVQSDRWASACERVCASSNAVVQLNLELVATQPSNCPASNLNQITNSATVKDPVLVEVDAAQYTSSGAAFSKVPTVTSMGILMVAIHWLM